MGYPDFYLVVPYKLGPRVYQTASPFLRLPPPPPSEKWISRVLLSASVPAC